AEQMRKAVRPTLLLLLAAVALLLLSACANVANLLLAQGVGRGREVAIRLALGAQPGRVVRQFLTESLALSVVAGTLGVILAWLSVPLLAAAGADRLPRVGSIEIDSRVLVVAGFVTLVTGLLFGAAPALQAARLDPARGLGAAKGGAGSDRRHNRLR